MHRLPWCFQKLVIFLLWIQSDPTSRYTASLSNPYHYRQTNLFSTFCRIPHLLTRVLNGVAMFIYHSPTGPQLQQSSETSQLAWRNRRRWLLTKLSLKSELKTTKAFSFPVCAFLEWCELFCSIHFQFQEHMLEGISGQWLMIHMWCFTWFKAVLLRARYHAREWHFNLSLLPDHPKAQVPFELCIQL